VFFIVFVGTSTGVNAWQGAVRRYAARRSLVPVLESRRLEHTTVSVAWLSSQPVNSVAKIHALPESVVIHPLSETPSHARIVASSRDHWRARGVVIDIDKRTGTVTLRVPPAAPEQVYWARSPHGYVIADDLRFFASASDGDLDERGIYALLQYGTVPAPISLFRNVQRAPNGHLTSLQHVSDEPSYTPMVPPGKAHGTRIADPSRWVAEALDAILTDIASPIALYFSGGVDSALLAARLKRVGRKDIQLFNFSFGPADCESRLAMQLAQRLDLPCTQITHDLNKVSKMLERIGSDYSFPFADFSTVPTNILVRESLSAMGPDSTVVEGTGADGAFGLAQRYPLWRRVYRIPRTIRRLMEMPYRRCHMWRYHGVAARLAGFIKKSGALPLELAVIAQNPLEGIAYYTPVKAREQLNDFMTAHARAVMPTDRGEAQLSLLDLMVVCAGTMAPKTCDPLRSGGVRTVYPYLDPVLVYGGSSLPKESKCSNGISKAVLKKILTADLPAKVVHRPKSGFTPPYRELFASPVLQEYFRGMVLDPHNPLLAFCEVALVRTMIDRARTTRLGSGTYDFLWALLFTSRWLTVNRADSSRRELAS
jgi:asparagine synthase (glutamine-hydrolysing)